MVKIKVTSLIEVMFIYLKIKAPHLKKKKKLSLTTDFGKSGSMSFSVSNLGNKS